MGGYWSAALPLLPLAPSPNSGCLSLRMLEEPHPLSLFFLTFSLTSLLLFSIRKGKARLFTQQKQCLLTFGKKKKREKSQRSFKVMMFEYLKTMNARNIDRSCVRLHSGSSAHYFISKNRRSSIFRGFVQSKCAIQTSCLSAPSPSSLPLCCCSSRSAPHLACPGVWGLGEDMGWEEDWVVGL